MPDRISEIRQLIKTDINAARKAVMPILKGIEAKGCDKEKAEIFHLTGLIEFYDGKSADAIKWYTKELRLRQKIKDIKGLSDVLNNIGVIYYNKGQLGKAIDYYRKALSHREAINDVKGIAGASENIGVVLFRTGMSVEAFNMYYRALEINRSLGDSEKNRRQPPKYRPNLPISK
jgi:tetratricopeptide (TPR) repeat protein